MESPEANLEQIAQAPATLSPGDRIRSLPPQRISPFRVKKDRKKIYRFVFGAMGRIL